MIQSETGVASEPAGGRGVDEGTQCNKTRGGIIIIVVVVVVVIFIHMMLLYWRYISNSPCRRHKCSSQEVLLNFEFNLMSS